MVWYVRDGRSHRRSHRSDLYVPRRNHQAAIGVAVPPNAAAYKLHNRVTSETAREGNQSPFLGSQGDRVNLQECRQTFFVFT